MGISVGDRAPEFRLPGTAGPTSLGDMLARGPAVLAFYPRDDTPG